MFKTFIIFVIVFLSISFAPIQKSFADEEVGRIAYTYGSAWVERGKQLNKLEKGQVLFRSDSIITGSRGRAKILMRDGSKVYVGAKSRISLRQYTMKKNKLFSATIHMLWGKARFFVNKLTTKNASFKVNTPTAVLGVRGTEFIVSVPPTPELLNQSLQHITLSDIPALPTRTALIEGAIQISTGIGKPVLLLPGNTADIGANKKIRTFKTSNDDIDKHEQEINPNSSSKSKKENASTQADSRQNKEEEFLTPPPMPKKGKIPSHANKPKRKFIKQKLSRPNPSDTANAVQNLNSTTDITIKPSFVKP
jgi:hypothetical protein